MKTLKVDICNQLLSHSIYNNGESYGVTEAIFNHIISGMKNFLNTETFEDVDEKFLKDDQPGANHVRASLSALAEAHGYAIEYMEN